MAIETRPSTTPQESAAAPLRSASARDRLSALFPDPSAPRASWWHRRRRVLVAVVVVAVLASAALAAQAFGANDPAYVTATVATHRVDALLNGVAAVEPVSQASVAFPVAGTVSSVDVKVGDTVAVSQPLASLDPEALTQTLHEKQAALAQAQLTLQRALNGESTSGTGNSGGGSSGNRVALTAVSIPRGATPSIAAAQQAVLAAQQKVDAALHTSTQASDAATTVCAAAGVGTTTPTTPTSEALTACQTATKAVVTAQAAVSAAQQELAHASSALDAMLTQQAAASSSGAGSGTGGSADGATGSTHAGTGSGSATGASTSPSAADLVADQKAVDAATADVAVAVQAIAQATVVSPIAGTVQAVNLAVGDTVTAGSSTANIVVVGPGGFEVTTTVSVDKVTDVKVGQPATFLPDGSNRPLTGSVTAISIAPDSAATTTSYRIVIGLTDPNVALNNGSTGSLTIVTKSSKAALAVPTSAVTTIGTRHTVTVLNGSTPERTLVQVGVIGATWTEITGGVTAGQHVVLANLAEPLPGSATNASNTTTNGRGFGTFPAGGFRDGARFGGPPGQ